MADDTGEEMRHLVGNGGDESSSVGPSLDEEMVGVGPALGDEILSCGDEVIETVLSLLFDGLLVPVVTKFTATTDVGDHVNSSKIINKCQ